MEKTDGGGSRATEEPSMRVCVFCGKRKGDQMLVCAEIDCPAAFHVKCFPVKPKFDQSGKFFCPYCSYKKAATKVEVLKRKATQAKLSLSDFLNAVRNGKKQKQADAPAASISRKENQGNVVAGSLEIRADAPAPSRKENQANAAVSQEKQADASAASTSENQRVGTIPPEKHADAPAASRNENERDVTIPLEKHAAAPASRNENQRDVSIPPEKHDDAPAASRNENQGNDVVSLEKAAPVAGKGPSIEREIADTSRASPGKQSRKEVKKVAVSKARRQRIDWVCEEEEMLQEGVKRFSDNEMRNIPWRRILEFGSRVFHPTRTPVDLKDKYRSMFRRNMMGKTLGKEPVEDETGEGNPI